jgi:hypothetical protein
MFSRRIDQRRICPTAALVATFLLSFLAFDTSPVQAQTPGLNAAGGMYYVCTYGYYKTRYISDVSGPNDAADALTKITTAFGNYVKAKYSLGNAGSVSCVYKFSAAEAKAHVSQLAKPSSDSTPVLTGWKYGDAAATSTESASPTASSQSSLPASTTAAAAQKNAAPSYFRCEITGRIANFVVAANDLRQGIPPKLGNNQCTAPGASCQWANGVLTLTEQAGGKPLVRIFDTVKGVYTTRFNGQDKPSTCTRVTN